MYVCTAGSLYFDVIFFVFNSDFLHFSGVLIPVCAVIGPDVSAYETNELLRLN